MNRFDNRFERNENRSFVYRYDNRSSWTTALDGAQSSPSLDGTQSLMTDLNQSSTSQICLNKPEMNIQRRWKLDLDQNEAQSTQTSLDGTKLELERNEPWTRWWRSTVKGEGARRRWRNEIDDMLQTSPELRSKSRISVRYDHHSNLFVLACYLTNI